LVRNRWIAAVFVLIAAAGVAGCGQAQTVPRKAARVTIGGATQTARPAACSQTQSYRTLDIGNHDAHVEAVVMLSGYRAIPQWVKIRNFGGFTGSFWQGGVGDARVELTNNDYTITGSAYGISGSEPNKTVTTDFKITAEC
jgi:hypothetical protein